MQPQLEHEFISGICTWCEMGYTETRAQQTCEVRKETLRAKHILKFMGLEFVEYGVDDRTLIGYVLADPTPRNNPQVEKLQRIRVYKFTLDMLEPFLPRPGSSDAHKAVMDQKMTRLQKAINSKIEYMREEVPDIVMQCMFQHHMQGKIKESYLKFWRPKTYNTSAERPSGLKKDRQCLGFVPVLEEVHIQGNEPSVFTNWKLAWYMPPRMKSEDQFPNIREMNTSFVENCCLQEQLDAFDLLPRLIKEIKENSGTMMERLEKAIFNH